MTYFFLIRHGQSDGNVNRILSGRNLPAHLTPKGIEQVKAVAEGFESIKIEAIYSSPIMRAVESAKILSTYLSVDVEIDEHFTETDMGLLEGKHVNEIGKEEADPIREFFSDSLVKYRLEKFSHIRERMMHGLQNIIQYYPTGNVIVVTHMDPVRSVVAAVLNLNDQVTRNLHVKNAALTVIYAEEVEKRLLAYNATRILDYLGSI